MYIDDQRFNQKGKTYRRVLLRNSYRANGKVCHDTIANLSKCSDQDIDAIKFALAHKTKLTSLIGTVEGAKTEQGLGVGAVWLLHQLAKRLGLVKTLGHSREAKLILWLIYATLIEPGSRLSAVRLAQRHAVCAILNLESFSEDDLYKAMDWLDEHQEKLEKRLFSYRYKDKKPQLFLYDVTSSYFEGIYNELADCGFNRDKKNGKKQIVIGLMTDEDGFPISVEVFTGNTRDLSTFVDQTKKVSNRFNCDGVTFVGDRGMIKGPQIAELDPDCHYITAISKPEIETLLKKGTIQMELFDESIGEVQEGAIRYIIRRNPQRAQTIEETRNSKLSKLRSFLTEQNFYLAEHKKANSIQPNEKLTRKPKSLKLMAG